MGEMPWESMPENQALADEMTATAPVDTDQVSAPDASGEYIPKSEVESLMKALKAERESRKTYEKELREKAAQLEKFAEINPQEYRRLQEEAAIAERERIAAEERTSLLEEKYGAQAAEAHKKAEAYQGELKEFRKRYALEKVFFAAGGRTDSADGVSFFDMLADRLGNNFRLEPNGSVVVVDHNGDPVLDGDTGKRVNPEDYLGRFKTHPIYGTFFRGAKGSGAGLGFSGSDANGMTADDLSELSGDELFARAFG
jgi:vacuolar-type H+-ATPase subunit I/STV1